MSPALDCIIPARNEAATVAANVAAAIDCSFVRDVVVVDDGSTDATAERAAAAGAEVVRLDASRGSKAHALRAGVDATDAELVLFADADCLGLSGPHLDAIAAPVLDGRAALSIGTFDYGRLWSPLVLRYSPLSGERCLPRWVFDAIDPVALRGYTIELRINDVVAAAGLPIVARTMVGVSHRTKRDKFGAVEGLVRTARMYRDLAGAARPSTYRAYRRLLRVEQPVGQEASAASQSRRAMSRRHSVSSAPSKIDSTRASTK